MSTSGSYGETNRVLRTGDTMSGPLTIGRLVGTDLTFQAVTAGDTNGRIQFLANGTIQWSDGTNPADTDLFRSAAGVLRTTNQFSIYRVGEAANAELRLSADAGFMENIRFRTGTLDRWGFQTDGSAEGGANAGTNLQIVRFDDAGVQIGTTCLTINRATGVVAIQNPGIANGAVVDVNSSQPLSNKTIAGFGATATTPVMNHRVTGDTQVRWAVDASGSMAWSPGSGALDTFLKRSAPGVLQATDTSLQSQRNSSALLAFSAIVIGADTNNRWQVTAGGATSYGPGNAAVDTTWQRSSAGTMEIVPASGAGGLNVRATASGSNASIGFLTGSLFRWAIIKNTTAESGANAGSDLVISSFTDAGGVLATPVTITRSTGTITTSGSVVVGSALRVQGNVGFYATAPVAKPTVTGSRGGNAALASLLTALAGQGLLTDSSTA